MIGRLLDWEVECSPRVGFKRLLVCCNCLPVGNGVAKVAFIGTQGGTGGRLRLGEDKASFLLACCCWGFGERNGRGVDQSVVDCVIVSV